MCMYIQHMNVNIYLKKQLIHQINKLDNMFLPLDRVEISIPSAVISVCSSSCATLIYKRAFSKVCRKKCMLKILIPIILLLSSSSKSF